MDAVVDNLSLTGNGREGTTVHFEKRLEWLPGAAGELLFKEASALAAEPVLDGSHGQRPGS
jgi:hypothetical protein